MPFSPSSSPRTLWAESKEKLFHVGASGCSVAAMVRKGFMIAALLTSLLAIGACSRAKIIRGPEGTAHLDCSRGMKDCVNQAAKMCGDEGYTIIAGQSRTTLVGARDSPYKKATESGQLDVRCGVEDPVEQGKSSLTFRLGPRKDEAPELAPSSLPSLPPPAAAEPNDVERACVPGATQRCLGPGACEGAQSCRDDGSGYGACDCGERTSTSSTSPPPPAPSVETPNDEPGARSVVGSDEAVPAPSRAQPAPPSAEPLGE